MTRHETFPDNLGRLSTDKPLAVAVLAMGGQGGGVLTDWIVAVAEAQGYVAQATSVPGVAQRTGATIYYIEMLPARDGVPPILSLMPTPGDVDVVIAAEFMEAGRSMLRGLVTPERTTLITSSHRSYAVGEKERPGDGIADPLTVVDAVDVAAKRTIALDLQSIASANKSVISSTLLGALAASDVLPFPKSAFEAAINAGDKGVASSLAAFEAAYAAIKAGSQMPDAAEPAKAYAALPVATGVRVLDDLLERLRQTFPQTTHAMLFAGMRRLVDYQDPTYAALYLDRMAALLDADRAAGGEAQNFAFTQEAAKYLANAMAYDDVIRVADLKTRGSRFARVRQEVDARPGQIVYMTEFMHPRLEEVIGALPPAWAHAIEARPRLSAALDRFINRGRRVRTGTVFAFLLLYGLSALKPWRSRMVRHGREMDHISHWLDTALSILPHDYPLAVEAIAVRRLVKGYSDTHARGLSKFDRVLAAAPRLVGQPEAAAWLRRLKLAALADEKGKDLEGALRTVAALSPPV